MIIYHAYTLGLLMLAGIILDIATVASMGVIGLAVALTIESRAAAAVVAASAGLGAVALGVAWLAGVPLEWLIWWWR